MRDRSFYVAIGMRTMGVFLTMLLVMFPHMAVAFSGADFSNSCYQGSWIENGDFAQDFRITNVCAGGTYVQWVDDLNLTVLGNVTDGELVINQSFIYVDSALRPDLDEAAELVFKGHGFAVEPEIFVDGIACGSCNVTQFSKSELHVAVPGFSNYSLQARQDFTVYSDYEPELDKKVYQTIDLGDANRGTQYACIVQVFGANQNNELILVQTNPERAVQARLLGNPDTNQPESLGYFPTTNGIANTYFRGDELAGYEDFELVIQCTSNSTKMIYEDPISTRYSPLGRTVTGRGIWLTDGNNGFFVAFYIFLAIGAMFAVGALWRKYR